MAVVYVHGVGNRFESPSDATGNTRDTLLRTLLLPALFTRPDNVEIISPYWGADGATFAWDLESANLTGIERLGPDDAGWISAALGGDPADVETALLALAKISLPDAVDLLYSVADQGPGTSSALLDFAPTVVKYCQRQICLQPDGSQLDRFPWLAHVRNDRELVRQLYAESLPADGPLLEQLGDGDDVQHALARVLGRIRRELLAAPAGAAVSGARRLFGRTVATLFGDVATYLEARGTAEHPGPIVVDVITGLERAVRATAPGEPLVVLAHSMGGNIVYDVLTHFRPDLRVDVLVTIGTQVALFEELKLFRHKRVDVTRAAGLRMPLPPGVRQWLNVVDVADPLAYRASVVFDGVTDYLYPSGAAWAHTAYLRQPNFHARLAARLAVR
ncbi:hypothetical protein GCM10009827_097530 [Dactylosporangium maewongense]|uniref:Uncharacterized protein n=1 Tax=Dactylosporangium maewongense TaxID=634393 RepID=A0ABN2CLN0_9ACTN